MNTFTSNSSIIHLGIDCILFGELLNLQSGISMETNVHESNKLQHAGGIGKLLLYVVVVVFCLVHCIGYSNRGRYVYYQVVDIP